MAAGGWTLKDGFFSITLLPLFSEKFRHFPAGFALDKAQGHCYVIFR
jgi:hypothetical protein